MNMEVKILVSVMALIVVARAVDGATAKVEYRPTGTLYGESTDIKGTVDYDAYNYLILDHQKLTAKVDGEAVTFTDHCPRSAGNVNAGDLVVRVGVEARVLCGEYYDKTSKKTQAGYVNLDVKEGGGRLSILKKLSIGPDGSVVTITDTKKKEVLFFPTPPPKK